MDEKVLYEMRFIETEDGYRVEVKGDKERMRKMHFGPGMAFGPWMRFWRRYRRGGPWKHGPGFGPWGWWWGEEEEEAQEEPPEEA